MGEIDLKVVEKPKGQIRIGLCVPMRGQVECNFMASFINIFIHFLQKPNTLPLPIFSEAMPIDAARNEISKQAILSQCDYLFWLDSDVVLFPNQIDHMWDLLHTPEADGTRREIVSGIYFQRAPPYHPVLRKFHKFHRYFDPENFMMEPVIDYDEKHPFVIDGAGMGCVLMRRKPHDLMFNATKGQPFQTIPNKVSEDLFFFGKLREGVKDHDGKEHFFNVWCDPYATCAHLGASVTLWHHKHAQADRFIDVEELASYTGEPKDQVLQKCADAPNVVMFEWLKRFGKPDGTHYASVPQEDIDEFYKTVDYRYDLTHYWSSAGKRREQVLSKLTFPADTKLNALDFGCGIGDFGLNLAEEYKNSTVIFYDINRKSLDYLYWRLAMRADDGSIRKDQCMVSETFEGLKQLGDVKFEVIFALDVFEHLKPALAVEYARWIYDHLNRNGVLIAYVAEMKPHQPQHISNPNLEDIGFVKLDDWSYCRPDSDIAAKVKAWQSHGKEIDDAKKG